MITAASLFSGIGAPEVAMPHWRWAWHAEIEKFPSAVMAQRHPQSINLGDVTAHDFTTRAAAIARPDVLVFGSPCQSFSIAGKRLGLDDSRGNLAIVALGIIDRLKPSWFVFENVPGLLSSAEGRDFGFFLRTVDELRYSLCWSVLDAQHFGVAQRRERVFAVGYIGDWRGPAAVLLEPQSLCGDHSPREQEREEIACGLGAGSKRSGGRVGRREAAGNQLIAGFNNTGQGWWNDAETAQTVRKGDDGGGGGARESTLVAHALNAHGRGRRDTSSETFVSHIAGTLPAGSNSTGGSRQPGMGAETAASGYLVAHALRADGFDASEDGTGRGTPLVPVAFDTTQITSKTNRCQPSAGDPCHPLAAGAHAPAIAYRTSGNCGPYETGDRVDALTTGTDQNSHGVMTASAVRRLMPVECERLQGFPDNYSAVTYRRKPATDGPRYKALGNSMAVPCVRRILTRIEMFECLQLQAAE